MSDEVKLSPVEGVKEDSQFLRGEIGAELTDGNDHFGKGSVQLLKHHGTYQQDNRDEREGHAGGKSEKSFIFMVRTRIPGGRLTSSQMLAELDLCDELANSTLRITTRQGLQLHGVLKENLRETIRRINQVQLSTLGACGDVERNIMCCPGPYHGGMYDEAQRLASALAHHLAPRTRAYHELWLQDESTGQRQLVGGGNGSEEEEVEPLYGRTYLPRKFKTAIGFPHDNCVDIYTNDLGLLAIVEDEQIVGYNVLVGGGQGVTPSAKKTFPALAKRMAFVRPDQVIDVATAVIQVQRDHGNRADRKVARLKYLIHNWGLPRFKEAVEQYYGGPLPDPHPDDVFGFNDHMGWEAQGDGRWFYGLNVENGRLADTDQWQLKTAVRRICRELNPGIRLTSHQSILFTDLADSAREPLQRILADHGVRTSEQTSAVRRWSMACVAWPTCGLAITESERALPGIIDQLEPELARLGLSSEVFTIRMTGCPNGCARPYNSDIGLVGKAKEKYTVLLGGRLLGNRLNTIYKDLVSREELIPVLVPLFAYFKAERQPNETFGDFCHRKGNDDLQAWSDRYAAQMTP
ncbi:MAG: NADPH-dependent assimilatory sulfite reductase hemoprotein subunit [Pirellulaceae bacterium]|nr:NADPH-dependent assimilatory sulfite reductase hemoprotein subunit [Pirellulaceae bacterium]